MFRNSFVSYVQGGYNNLENSVFGFAARSEFLQFVLECLRHNQDVSFVPSRTGPTFFTTCFVQFADPKVISASVLYSQGMPHWRYC